MTDIVNDFIAAMRDHGAVIMDPEACVSDDKVRRLHMEGDARGAPSVTYQLDETDGFGFGWFVAWKIDGQTVAWNSKPVRGETKERRKQSAEWLEHRRAAAEAERARAREEARDRIASIWNAAWPCDGHGYFERKGIKPCPGLRVHEDEVLVPMWREGVMVGCQRIPENGKKRFLYGTEAAGATFEIAGNCDSVIVTEGLATGIRISAATGWCAVVAFSSGQMVAAAKVARDMYPDARIIVAGDNDQWVFDLKKKPTDVEARAVPGDDPRWAEWRDAGLLVNPGAESMQAAVRVGAIAMLPPIPADDAEKRTDWDDYAATYGEDALRTLFLEIPDTRSVEHEEYYHEHEFADMVEDLREDAFSKIKPLGHDKGVYFFFPASTGQIMEFTATALAQPANLYSMAPRAFWDSHYNHDGKMSSRQIADIASSDLMDACRSKRIFNPDNLRGVGVWKDGEKIVLNTGTKLYVDGEVYKPQEYNGKAVYEAGHEAYSFGAEPLLNAEANVLREICKRFSWRNPLMGDLLAGLLVLAPISGVLRWRPHGVLTGEAGSGKSTINDQVIKPVIGDIGIYLNGGSTEAGLRKKIGLSARPVIMDEAESETKRAKENMDAILFLARNASSGASTANANADSNIRSCFILSAINPRITQGPDKGRFTSLELVRNKDAGAEVQWRDLEFDIKKHLTEDFSRRLFARTIANLPTLLKNIDAFGLAATRVHGNARAGDQIGALLAGAYSLTSTREVDEVFAEEWIKKQDWQFHDADVAMPENEKFLSTVLTMRLRYDKDGMSRESTIGSLIEAAADMRSTMHIESVDALKQVGIMVRDDRLIFANSSPTLSRMLRDTIWTDWRRLLMMFEGSDNYDNKTVYFASAIRCKVTSIPLGGILGGAEAEVVEDQESPF